MSRPDVLTDLHFERHTQILDFGVHPPRGARNTQFVAWPVLAYRVAVPEGTPDLNPLQRGVMRLLQADPTLSLEDVAPLLQLHPSLVRLIADELIERGWLDDVTRARTPTLTPAGVALLRGERPDLNAGAHITTGFVFQDPFTGEAHPHFMPALLYATLEEGREWPRLLPTWSEAAPPEPLYLELGRVRPPDRLSTRAIADAYAGIIQTQDLAPDSLAAQDAREAAGRVRVLDPLPRPLLLVTAVYFEADDYEDDWVVANPFATRDSDYSPVLRRSVQRREDTSRRLQQFLAGLYGQERQHEAGSARQFMQHARAEAERRAQVHLSGLPEHHLLRKHVVRCQLALIEAESLHGDSPEKLDAVMGQVRKVAESTVLALRDLHGVSMTHDQFHKKPDLQKDLNAAAAAQLGFTAVPTTLIGVGKRKLEQANAPGADQFRGLLMACVHMATKDPAHPLARAGRREPELLQSLDGLFDVGSKSVHAQPNLTYTLAQVQQAAEAAFRTACSVFKP